MARIITRRSLVAASSALIPAAAVAASACGPGDDPILAAIDHHRRVYADLVALFAAQDAAGRALRAADDSTRPLVEARLSALCAAEGPLGRAEMRAADRLAETVPSTLAGAAAALRYVRERFAHDDYVMFEEDGYRALLMSTECAMCRAAGLPEPR